MKNLFKFTLIELLVVNSTAFNSIPQDIELSIDKTEKN